MLQIRLSRPAAGIGTISLTQFENTITSCEEAMNALNERLTAVEESMTALKTRHDEVEEILNFMRSPQEIPKDELETEISTILRAIRPE